MDNREFSKIINSTKAVVLGAIEKHLAQDFYHSIDDVVQETYIRAYRGLTGNKFRGDSKIETWLYAIARNESLRMNKKLIREEEKLRKSLENMQNENKNNTTGSDHEIENLHLAIEKLPDNYKSVMELVLKGFSIREIAHRLDIKAGTVKSRTSRGREMLQKIYTGGVK